MATVFWVSAALIGYVYFAYPVLLKLYCAVRRCGVEVDPQSANPSSGPRNAQRRVSIVIAARNEGARLAARLENLLALDYPRDRREIIVVSDGSTDDTMEAIAAFGGDVVAIEMPPGGKALALNAGVARAAGDIIVFADARQVFAPDALRELTTPFADPRVGAVTGELLLDAEPASRRATADRRSSRDWPEHGRLGASAADRRSGVDRRRTLRSTIADGVGLYWRYEKQLRRLESAVDSTLGATGAIYAIRRTLFEPLPPDTILDDVLTPMRVVLAGYRVVFNERAKAFDRAAVDADAEARRKVRTLAGNFQILALEPRLLLPWTNRVWLQYASHKLGRLAVPYAILAAFASSVVLATSSLVYAAALATQVMFLLLAGCGALIEMRGRTRVAGSEFSTRYSAPAAREVA
jgi:poly-beta-1,6-N-acetyl-D-glucosamine synthase